MESMKAFMNTNLIEFLLDSEFFLYTFWQFFEAFISDPKY